MAIPENQLSTWSNQGATKTSQLTYNSIKTCVDNISWNSDIKYKIYLQGSYKNYTNIRANSDIDVVVEFSSVFYSNRNELTTEESEDFNETYDDGKYSLNDFRVALIESLNEYYDKKNIDIGDKAIRIDGFNGRLDADIVCCVTYRNYQSFKKTKTTDYIEGITFFDSESNDQIINFPNKHYKNGATKNSNSNTNFKSTVRIIKNIKSKLIESNQITKEECPSYYIECLSYNVPDKAFKETNYASIVFNVLKFWEDSIKNDNLENFVCQNEIIDLFGPSDQQWSTINAKKFINRSITFWNNY
jgi:predicted nucleotidyltransferase